MALLNLAAGAPTIFLSKNYLNRFAFDGGAITVISGDDFIKRLFDMDPRSIYSSLGSDDLTTEVIEFELWTDGSRTLRLIDYLAIMNHNVKKIKIETSDDNGATFTTRLDVDNLTETDTRVTLAAPVDSDRVRVSLFTTQTVDEEKTVGTIIVALATFQATNRPINMRRLEPRVGQKSAVMHDKSIRRSHIFRSAATFDFWLASFDWLADDKTERAKFRNLMRFDFNEFIVLPEPGEEAGEAFLTKVQPDSYKDDYLVKSQSGGYLVSAILEEVGGQ